MELQKFIVQSSLSSLVLFIFGAKYSWKGLPYALQDVEQHSWSLSTGCW